MAENNNKNNHQNDSHKEKAPLSAVEILAQGNKKTDVPPEKTKPQNAPPKKEETTANAKTGQPPEAAETPAKKITVAAEKKKRRYITGFDGIRSIAVIGVILYHLMPTSMKGGYLGVPIFFVLSGYLITDLLVQEWENNQRISLRQFYVRRMKRLYPAMLALFLFATTYITLFQRNLLRDLRQIVITSLLYVNNWWQISNGLSYFDRFGNESPFTHIWSLAVEGQNYLLWPILFIILIRFVKKKPKIFYTVFGLAAISALLMGILYQPGADPTRVYYGTDTRLFSILLGSGLAFIWPSTGIKEKINNEAKQTLNIIGGVSLVLMIAGLFVLGAQMTAVYYGGMFIYSIICALVVAVTVHPGASLNRWLTNPVFTWIGKRSYGIYLYQFPIMIFYESKVPNLNELLWLHTIIELALILGASELSYRFIEEPFRKADYGRQWQKFKLFFKRPQFSKQQLVYVPLALMLIVSLVGLGIAPVKGVTPEQEALQKQIAANKELAEKTKQQEEAARQAEEEAFQQLFDANAYGLTDSQLQAAFDLEISGFGDSLMLASAAEFQKIFPKIIVDADIGRQLIDSPELITKMAEENQLATNVVISLGANGPFTETQFDEVMTALGERNIYWVNLRLPTQRWEAEVNQMLAKMADKYDNLTVIDWYDYSQGHDDWFYEDRVHPNNDGAVAYSGLVAREILKNK